MRFDEFAAAKTITESQNVFKDEEGNQLTQRIVAADIAPTIQWLENITGLPLVDNTLGSVGKKESSGDLDLAVDQNAISKDTLIERLVAWLKKQGIPEGDIFNKSKTKIAPAKKDGWIDKTGISVHFKAPIKGDPKKGFAQTDFMFGDDIEQMKFGLWSAGDASKFSGADRNLLMSSIAKSLPGDFKYSWQKSLIKRSTGEPISKNPDAIASVLLGKGHTGTDLESVESIMAAVKKDSKRLQALKNLATSLRNEEGKKPGDAKADADEADRINRILNA